MTLLRSLRTAAWFVYLLYFGQSPGLAIGHPAHPQSATPTDTTKTIVEEEDVPVYTAHDVAPQPIGGYEAIQENLVIPESSGKPGFERRVMVWVKVGKQGKVLNTQIMRSSGDDMHDKAAMKAIQSVEWKPAMQRNRSVDVWIAVPFNFKYKEED